MSIKRLPFRPTAPVLTAAAAFVAIGGYVHLREWLESYRHVPAGATGSAVVRIGFPVNAVLSAVLAIALLVCAVGRRRLAPQVVAGAALFQAGSLAVLIATRTGSVFGWAEPIWTRGATQSRAVEIGALVSLAAVATIAGIQRRRSTIAPIPVMSSGSNTSRIRTGRAA
jgi:hypothetical protein